MMDDIESCEKEKEEGWRLKMLGMQLAIGLIGERFNLCIPEKPIKNKSFDKCCVICEKFETGDCPVSSADPWSKYKNYCSEFKK